MEILNMNADQFSVMLILSLIGLILLSLILSLLYFQKKDNNKKNKIANEFADLVDKKYGFHQGIIYEYLNKNSHLEQNQLIDFASRIINCEKNVHKRLIGLYKNSGKDSLFKIINDLDELLSVYLAMVSTLNINFKTKSLGSDFTILAMCQNKFIEHLKLVNLNSINGIEILKHNGSKVSLILNS